MIFSSEPRGMWGIHCPRVVFWAWGRGRDACAVLPQVAECPVRRLKCVASLDPRSHLGKYGPVLTLKEFLTVSETQTSMEAVVRDFKETNVWVGQKYVLQAERGPGELLDKVNIGNLDPAFR